MGGVGADSLGDGATEGLIVVVSVVSVVFVVGGGGGGGGGGNMVIGGGGGSADALAGSGGGSADASVALALTGGALFLPPADRLGFWGATTRIGSAKAASGVEGGAGASSGERVRGSGPFHFREAFKRAMAFGPQTGGGGAT